MQNNGLDNNFQNNRGNKDSKNNFNRFLIQVIITGVVVFGVFFGIRFLWAAGPSYQEALTSLVICSLNVIAGARFIMIGLKKSNNAFMSIVFGSLAIRIIILIGFIVTGLLVAGFDTAGFIISLFSFYFVFLIIELVFLFRITKSFNK